MPRRISVLLAGASIGAASMYFLDPRRGRRRRHGLEDRARAAIDGIEDIAGKAVRDTANRMRGTLARARGATGRSSRRRGLFAEGLPERRLFEAGAGISFALWGLLRGGFVGLGAFAGGAALLSRAIVARQDGIIRVQKTATIRAPVERVFGFWSHFENFPHFMEHVVDVQVDGDRSHWRVVGPMGVAVEWDAEITERIENRKIAWRSVSDGSVDHHGEVHFERLGENLTRISIHMAYNPPGGSLGHALAAFMHGDPKTLMDDDLLRLKSLLETGKTRIHSRRVTSQDVH
jgi:uncharacterized membrane protein